MCPRSAQVPPPGISHAMLCQGHKALEPPPQPTADPRSEENVLTKCAELLLSSPVWIPAGPSVGDESQSSS